ncbi:MAG: phosphocholine cytidylyltransferase family protein [bacterium]|nr:phosphocholine cytidylyltransferase family protein [bacterium]
MSAGQGRRLARATDGAPKCLVPIHGGQSLLELQLRSLARCGIERVVVMVGYGADRVESEIASIAIPGLEVATGYNPFSATSDNLVTTWLARSSMDEDFLLLNGDTLFEDQVLKRLLAEAHHPVAIAVAQKPSYDEDDMKVVLGRDGRLDAIGKQLAGLVPDGEAIGMTIFRGEGIDGFRRILDEIVRTPDGGQAWYTAALDGLAARLRIETVPIGSCWWAEVDTLEDLRSVREVFDQRKRLTSTEDPPGRTAASFA